MCLSVVFSSAVKDFTFWRPVRLYQSSRNIRQSRAFASEMKVLNVAEKNDAAKNIAFHLSGGNVNRREGFSKFNKIYEFNYTVRGDNARMVMTSVSGHLLGLDFTGQYRNWRGCNPLALFDAPVTKYCPDDYQNIKRTLEREVRSCQMLIIWTDCDREGERIGFEIIETCQAIKPNIQLYRARFSEITPQSVRRAMSSLEAPNRLMSDAVEVRQELDLRIGAAFTRFQTLRLQQVFPQNLGQQLISYGSCQFPTLGFVVERYKAIERFIPEPFWRIAVQHTVGEVKVDFSWKRVRLFDELACQVLFDTVQENTEALVEKVLSKPKSKWRPLPLDTIELEKLGSKRLKINAKETMRIAERLYTQGFISYPRTETNIFPPTMDLPKLIEMQTRDNRWGGFAQTVLTEGANPRRGKKSDQAHPPIHPTKYVDNLQGNEARVYEFIVRHFLACCSKDAQGHETVVDIDINGEKFVASGLTIIARNYLDVYPYENWSAKEIHPYEEGQRFQPSKIEKPQGETNAPNPLTEADLIALMEKHGIGTDATHAEHIETIKNRSYVGVDRNYFLPGELGLGLVDGYDSMGFSMSKPHLRAQLEADLQRIVDGSRNAQEVLAEQIRNYKTVFERAIQQASKIDVALANYLNEERHAAAENAGGIMDITFKKVCACPLCGQDMLLKTKNDGSGFYISCMGFPGCRGGLWFPNFVEHVDVADDVCNVCAMKPQKLKFRFKQGYQPYYPNNYAGCVGGCDQNLIDVLGTRSLRSIANRNADVPRNANRGEASQDSGIGSQNTTSRSNFASQARGGGGRESQSEARPRAVSNTAPNATRGGFGRGGTNGTRTTERNQQMLPGGDSLVCQCNVDAIQLTVRKDGPNQGRHFYKCGNNSSCNFFMWADEGGTPPSNTGGHGAAHQSTLSNVTPANNGADGEIMCVCGDAAVSRTVNKDGPNKGRQFFVCPKPRESQCDFFHWADAEGQAPTSNTGGNQGAYQSTASNFTHANTGADGDVVCKCGDAAVSRTVNKDGPNKGREFFVCPKPRESQCDFFQWADAEGQANPARGREGGGGGPGRGRGHSNWSAGNSHRGGFGGNQNTWKTGGRGAGGGRGGGSNTGAGGAKGKRKCSNCGKEGHFRPKCPDL